MRRALISLGIIAAVTGCKQPTIASNSVETKPQGLGGDGSAYNALSSQAKPTFESTYNIQIFTKKNGTETPMCNGTIVAQLLSNSQMTFPDADFKCRLKLPLIGEKDIPIPIAKLLGAPKEENLPKDASVPVDGRYVGIKYAKASEPMLGAAKPEEPQRMEMNPAAPFILGPIISRSSDFDQFRVRQPITVRTDKTASTGKTYSGAVGIYVQKIQDRYTIPDNSYTFDDVIYWVRVSEGFEDLPGNLKTVGPMLGIKELHFWQSPKPIAFTRIVILLHINSLLDFGGGKILANMFVGDMVTIKLELLKHREL